MPSMFAYFAPLALIVPLGLTGNASDRASDTSAKLDRSEVEMISEPGQELRHDVFGGTSTNYQVRIERRVTIRIAPRSAAPRQSLMADLQRAPQPQRYEEREMADCLPVGDIAGVQTGGGNQLVLFLRNQRMVSARLEKSCRAREFYSGFYLERSEDGMLCVDRDKLQSRAGAKCELALLRELVPIYD